MYYTCYDYEDDRPDEMDEEIEHHFEIWLSNQETLREYALLEYAANYEYADEHATVIEAEAAHNEADVQQFL